MNQTESFLNCKVFPPYDRSYPLVWKTQPHLCLFTTSTQIIINIWKRLIKKMQVINPLGSYLPLGLTQPRPHFSTPFTQRIINIWRRLIKILQMFPPLVKYLNLGLTQPYTHWYLPFTKIFTNTSNRLIKRFSQGFPFWDIAFPLYDTTMSLFLSCLQ